MRKYSRILAMIISIALIFSDTGLQAFAYDNNNSVSAVTDNTDADKDQIFDYDLEESDDPQWGREHGFYQDFNEGENEQDANVFNAHDPKFAGYDVTNGIDVSKWQGSINWSQVKAAGIDFAFVRVGFRGGDSGALATDSTYATNLSGATGAGIKTGVYIFSQAITPEEAREEARYAINLAKGYKITMPIVMDFEYMAIDSSGNKGRLYNAHLSREAATAVCTAFCETVKASGYEPMIYANKSMLRDQLNASELSSKYKIWLAHYVTTTDYAGDYNFWQYSSKGSVSGISGNVDMNYWYHIPCKITYHLDGGTNDSRNPVKYSEGSELPLYDATKEGYVFKGWYTESSFKNKVTKITSSFRGNINLYAKWDLNAYFVKYDANAKSLNRKASGETKDSVMKFDNDDNKLNANGFKVAGYRFTGWNTRADGKGKSFGDKNNKGAVTVGSFFQKNGMAKKIGDVVTLYAQWEPVIRVVSFYKNDGDNNELVVTENVLAGDKIEEILDLDSEAWKRPGYKLAYWSTSRYGKGKKYTEVDEAIFSKGNSEASLYAQWKPETYKITYVLDGGKNNKNNPKKYNFESANIYLQEPTKKGYTFVKWIDDSETDTVSANAITEIKRGSYGDVKLRAVWQENVYTVNYHIEDTPYATVSENVISVNYRYTELVNMSEVADKITVNDTYADQKGIVAWTSKAGGKGKTYKTSKQFYKLAADDGAIIDVYAKWGIATYNIAYDLDGGILGKTNPLSYSYNKKKAVKIGKPVKTGYVFKGWQAVSGNTTIFASDISKIEKGARGSVTLKAEWRPAVYNIKLNTNTKDTGVYITGDNIIRNIEFESSVSQNIVPSIKVPDYYVLKGWNTKANGKGKSLSMNALGEIEVSGLSTKDGSTVNLYAQLEPVKYNINYVYVDPDNNNEVLTQVTNKNPQTYSYGKAIKFKDPVKYGFIFKGWYSDKECTRKMKGIPKNSTGEITVYAKWKVK